MNKVQNDGFLKTMNAMRSHYKKTNVEGFDFKGSLKLFKSDAELEKIVGAIQSDAQASSTNFNATSQTELTGASEQMLDAPGDPKDKQAAFKKRMNAIRDKQKATAELNIDVYIDKMIDAGVKNPEHEEEIIGTADVTLTFMNKAIGTIIGFVSELVEKIVDWVYNVYKEITEFFSNAADAIGNFFGSIFSFKRENYENPLVLA